MDVVVIRHGIAMDRDEALERAIGDRDRPLTEKGRARMKRNAKGLARRAPGVTTMFTSPLRRAIETAEIVEGAYGDVLCTRTPALLPEADADELAHVLGDLGGAPIVGVVGHEPHLTRFVTWCLSGDQSPVLELKKGGACLLRFEEVPGQKRGRLIWLAPPAILRHI